MAKADYATLLGRLAKARVAKSKKAARLKAKGKKPRIRVSVKRANALQKRLEEITESPRRSSRPVGKIEF